MARKWYKGFGGSIAFHLVILLLVGFLAQDAFVANKEDEEEDIIYTVDAGGGGGSESQKIIQPPEKQVQTNSLGFLQDLNPIVKKDEKATDNTVKSNTNTNDNTNTGNQTNTDNGDGSGDGDGSGGEGGGKGDGKGDGSGEGDGGQAPTVPPRLKYSVEPIYPEEARANNIEGSVGVRILVNQAGTVDDVTITRSSGRGDFDQSAINAARQYRFDPALNAKGNPVRARASISVGFNLR